MKERSVYMAKKVGFIGLGLMGLPMSLNLLKKSNLPVMGYDLSEERLQTFDENGGEIAETPIEVYEHCDIIFLCLPSNNLVKSNIQDVIRHGKKGTVVVDFSSTSPAVIKEMYAEAKQVGIHVIDSPVSGGEPGAIAGKLVIMCGGDQVIFDEVKPLISHMGSSVTYMGETGCGSVAKLANNMIAGCYIGAMSEGLAFAVKAGLNPETLFHAIKDGYAGSPMFAAKAPKIMSRDFEASARVAVHQKDLRNAVELAEDLQVEIPMSQMVLDYMDELERTGRVNEDHCAIAKIYEERMGIEIKK